MITNGEESIMSTKLTIPSGDIEVREENNNTIISIKNSKHIVFDLDGDTMFKSNGKIFFVSDEEIGFISKKNIHLESIDSKIYMNSRQCSLIKDKPESIEYRVKKELEHNQQRLFVMKQESFIKSLKERVSDIESKLAQIEQKET